MLTVDKQLPARRTELLIRPLGDEGQYVVKDPATGAYFHLGEEEGFLLTQLDGRKDAEAIGAAYAERFAQALAEEDLDEFVRLAETQGFLQPTSVDQAFQPDAVRESQAGNRQAGKPDLRADATGPPSSRQSLLYWRKNFFDPDRLFTWLEPKLWFFWTRGFLIFSAGCIVLAAGLVWLNRGHVASSFVQALRWETVVWTWLTLLVVTALHESAHGLTCKHYGGEVHEIGFLLMFFMPCFYCNVSDAWLFKEKSKRLWVTFAGGYFELFVWALAVFVWRLTLPGSLPNYLALIVVAACGVQTLFNFNPLLKLDGYYLVSDWVEIPNLQQLALDYLKGHARWLLWGAARPERQPRAKFLFRFGLASWLYSLVFLALMLWGFFAFLGSGGSWLGIGFVALLGLVSARGLFQGFAAGEVSNMFTKRPKRTLMWLLVLGGLPVLWFIPMDDRAGGSFQVRPAVRAELRAPVAGFLKEIFVEEGDQISSGVPVVRLEIPDLDSRLAQKSAEVREAQAKLRLLEIGARPEEVAEQRKRVERSVAWRDLARHDLKSLQQALAADLIRLDKQIAACRAELLAAQAGYERTGTLLAQKAASREAFQEAESKQRVCQALLERAQAERDARQAKGTLEAEGELARREKELADAQAILKLLEAGSRPEEIQAQRARVACLQHETRYLAQLQDRLLVGSPVSGFISTPRLKEKAGQYVREGELICVIEEASGWEAEITLAEEDVAAVQAGQAVALKARALPFATIPAKVERIAAAAGRGEVQSTVTIYCRLDASPPELRPGMTGYARIYTGRRPIGAILFDRAWRFLRTEFWW